MGKVPAHHPPLPFKKTCPCTILPPLFLIFLIPPLWGRYLKFTFPLLKKDGGPNYIICPSRACHLNNLRLKHSQNNNAVPEANFFVFSSTKVCTSWIFFSTMNLKTILFYWPKGSVSSILSSIEQLIKLVLPSAIKNISML